MTEKLDPPDPVRCQAEWTAYRPFVMGGRVQQPQRCSQQPTIIITERQPGEDGQRGSMSPCDEHYAVFLKQAHRPAVDVWRKAESI